MTPPASFTSFWNFSASSFLTPLFSMTGRGFSAISFAYNQINCQHR